MHKGCGGCGADPGWPRAGAGAEPVAARSCPGQDVPLFFFFQTDTHDFREDYAGDDQGRADDFPGAEVFLDGYDGDDDGKDGFHGVEDCGFGGGDVALVAGHDVNSDDRTQKAEVDEVEPEKGLKVKADGFQKGGGNKGKKGDEEHLYSC